MRWGAWSSFSMQTSITAVGRLEELPGEGEEEFNDYSIY